MRAGFRSPFSGMTFVCFCVLCELLRGGHGIPSGAHGRVLEEAVNSSLVRAPMILIRIAT